MGLAAAAALLAAVGSVVSLSSAATIYGQETASLADQATAQDLVNLLLVAPLVLVLGWRAHRGHLAAYLGWLGCVAFTVYNYAIYAFSIHFGPLFLVWIGVLGLSIFALLGSLATVDTSAIKACFAGRPLRWPGWFLIVAAALFTLLWLSEILPDLLAQRPSRSASEWNVPTSPVHVLDLAFFLPAAATTGVLVLRRHRWGYATVAGQLTWLALDLPTDHGHSRWLLTPVATSPGGRSPFPSGSCSWVPSGCWSGCSEQPGLTVVHQNRSVGLRSDGGWPSRRARRNHLDTKDHPSPPQIPRRALLAAGAGLGAAGLLALVGPHPVGPARRHRCRRADTVRDRLGVQDVLVRRNRPGTALSSK